MLLGLNDLSDDYSHVHDQILGSPVVPNFTFTCSTLQRMPVYTPLIHLLMLMTFLL